MDEDWTADADLAGRLARRLADDLGAFEVGPAPVGSAVGWGKAIKTRRRAAWAGALSAVVVAAVTLPFAMSSRPVDVPPPPWTNHPATAHHTVTVDPPRSAPDGSPVWSGSIDGARWSTQAGAPDQPGFVCLTGRSFQCTLPRADDQFDKPAGLEASATDPAFDAFLVGMDPGVTGIDVHLDDGTDLRLQPAVYEGHRLAVFRLPHGYPIDRIVAHLPAGDQTAIGLNLPDAAAKWGVWYPAGAVPDVPTASAVITSRTGGESASRAPRLTVYVGPFGDFVDTGVVAYGPSKPHPFPGLDIEATLANVRMGHTSMWAFDEVSDAVDSVVLEYPDGTREVLRPVEVGGIRFVAAFLRVERLPLRAVAYNAAHGVITVSDANHGAADPATPSAP